ncbi:BRCA1-A complex subunit Abraxas 1-like [Watersipora subatra]|uniref:BRCA1-A complex subunit Abraxas 1-like n=1 Tax=Watersipora subatra TaxID=2589382 RepID=UPI00355AEFD0
MVSVELYGGVFSSTLFNQLLSPSNQEGILLGRVELQTKNSISDNDINDQKECLVYMIESTLNFPTPRCFYDKDGRILPEKIQSLLNGRPIEKVIGWYRSRQHAAFEMTMWERSIHYNLSDYMLTQQGESRTNLMFGIFTSQSSKYFSTRLQSTRFLVLKDSGKFAPVAMNIRNLGNTSSEYKFPVCSDYCTSQKYRAICDKHRARLVDEPHQTVHSTKQIDSISNDMCQQLQDLCREVEKSEAERTTLLEEVEDMKKILCLTISQSVNLNPAIRESESFIGESHEPLNFEQHEEPRGTVEYLIDFEDYTANQMTPEANRVNEWSGDAVVENLNTNDGQLPKAKKTGIDDLLLLPSNSSNDLEESFVLVGKNSGTSLTTVTPQNNLATAMDDDEKDMTHSSPPASPIY